MNSEMFSIVMPVYNSENTIAQSIQSVLNQSYKNFKLYIVDDYSTDTSERIILRFQDQRIVYLKNTGKRGVANARNVALDRVSGTYISFLDSDDLWLQDKLLLQFEALQDGHDLVFSCYYTFRHHPEYRLHYRRSPPVICWNDLLKINYIGNLTAAYNARKIGVLRQKDIGHEDYLMWLEVIGRTQTGYCIQQPLALYRLSGTSVSANKLKAAYWQWKIYRYELQFSFIKSLYYFINYVFRSIIRRVFF